MKLTILKERDTPLLSRKRVTCEVLYEGATPSRLELKKSVAKQLKADEKLVILKHIYTKFGKQKAKVIAHVYEKEEDLKKLEHEKLVAKHSPKKEEKKEDEEAKPAPKAEEKPAEEKKEEPAAPEKPSEEKKDEGEKPKAPGEKKEEGTKEEK